MHSKQRKLDQRLLERRLDCLREIDARLRFVHPSQGVVILPWYPICVPLQKENDRRDIILNLNGILCHIVETQYD